MRRWRALWLTVCRLIRPLDPRFIGRVLAPCHDDRVRTANRARCGGGAPVGRMGGVSVLPDDVAAPQAGATYEPPSLLAEDAEGQWIEVLPKVGYPAGMPADGAPGATAAGRVSTSAAGIDLQVTGTVSNWSVEPCDEVRRHVSQPLRATVFAPGFPYRTTDAWFRPDYDWARAVPFWDTAQRGFYTTFGAGHATGGSGGSLGGGLGTGEAIRCYPVQDQLPEGWSRRHVLDLVGWCKDMDIANLEGETVGPLPGGEDSTGLNEALNTRYRSGW